MSSGIAISARGLGKRYRRQARTGRHDSLRDAVAGAARELLRGSGTNAGEDFWALREASFDIAQGENVGVIGLNGAGKSTLLKILSRIVTPTTGTAHLHGRLGALLEVGTGFHQELSGRENTFLYGSILGMSRAEVARKFDQIVDFSEIGEFIDVPVKRYSSGMYVRLAFAVAAHLDPDILLLDEVLAVGDFVFQRKCMKLVQELEKKGSTILFVSHNMFTIKTMCPRVIYLVRGEVAFDGPTDEGLQRYEDASALQKLHWFDEADPPIAITSVRILDQEGRETSVVDYGAPMRVHIRYNAKRRLERPDFRVGLTRADEVHCATFSTTADELDIPAVEGEGALELETPPVKLVSDRYTLRLVVRERGYGKIVAAQTGRSFHVRHPVFAPEAFGVFHEGGRWRIMAAAITDASDSAAAD